MESEAILTSWTVEFSRPSCRPEAQTLHCIARLNEDIGPCLPYLNALIGADVFMDDPPSMTLKVHGKLITLHGDRIAINAVRDPGEAEKILAWLKEEINRAWAMRKRIEPSYESVPRPGVMDILRLLPKTNCKKCGLPSCMVFAAQAAEGGRSEDQCPELGDEEREKLAFLLRRCGLDRHRA